MSEKSIWDELARPLTDDEIEWRVLRSGMGGKGVWAILAPYADSRAIMTRLDDAVGPANWSDQYRCENVASGSGCICRLGVCAGDVWVYHEDGAGFDRDVETFKSGISDALKRAAVKFGIGRHLYDLPTVWGRDFKEGTPPKDLEQKAVYVTTKDNSGKRLKFWCIPPKLADLTPDPAAVEAEKAREESVMKADEYGFANGAKKDDVLAHITDLEGKLFQTHDEVLKAREEAGLAADLRSRPNTTEKLKQYAALHLGPAYRSNQKRIDVLNWIMKHYPEGYDNAHEFKNSCKKHMDVDRPSDCDDLDVLIAFAKHVNDRIKERESVSV